MKTIIRKIIATFGCGMFITNAMAQRVVVKPTTQEGMDIWLAIHWALFLSFGLFCLLHGLLNIQEIQKKKKKDAEESNRKPPLVKKRVIRKRIVREALEKQKEIATQRYENINTTEKLNDGWKEFLNTDISTKFYYAQIILGIILIISVIYSMILYAQPQESILIWTHVR